MLFFCVKVLLVIEINLTFETISSMRRTKKYVKNIGLFLKFLGSLVLRSKGKGRINANLKQMTDCFTGRSILSLFKMQRVLYSKISSQVKF